MSAPLLSEVGFVQHCLDSTEESFTLYGLSGAMGSWWLQIEVYLGYVMGENSDTDTFDNTLVYRSCLDASQLRGVGYSKAANTVVLYGQFGPVWAVEGIDDSEALYVSLERRLQEFQAGLWNAHPVSD